MTNDKNQNVAINDEMRGVFDRMLGIDKGTPATQSEKQKALKKANSYANGLIELTFVFVNKFEEYCNNHPLKFSDPVAFRSTTDDDVILEFVSSEVVSSLLAYSLVSICFIEKVSIKGMFGSMAYLHYQHKMSLGLHILVSKNVEKIAKVISNDLEIKDVSGGVSRDCARGIEAFVKISLQSKFKVAQECVTNLQNSKEIPLLPLYESIAPYFGGKADASVLKERFGKIIDKLLNEVRSEFDGIKMSEGIQYQDKAQVVPKGEPLMMKKPSQARTISNTLLLISVVFIVASLFIFAIAVDSDQDEIVMIFLIGVFVLVLGVASAGASRIFRLKA